MTENTKWLISCPMNDGNFKVRLQEATEEEILEAMLHITQQTKLVRLQSRLRALRKQRSDL